MSFCSYFPHLLADLREIWYGVSFYYTHQNICYQTLVNLVHVSDDTYNMPQQVADVTNV